jgi:starch synthase
MTPPITPSTDKMIACTYSASSLEKKLQNKTALQQDLGWVKEPKRPLICMPTKTNDEMGGELLKELIPGLLALDIELVIRGNGSRDYGKFFTTLADEHKHRFAILPNDEAHIRQMYAAADMALFCTDPKGLSEVEHALAYGAIPIAPLSKALENYNPIQESGNAFLFNLCHGEPVEPWNAFAAVVRAVETYRFPFDWRTIQKQCMNA